MAEVCFIGKITRSHEEKRPRHGEHRFSNEEARHRHGLKVECRGLSELRWFVFKNRSFQFSKEVTFVMILAIITCAYLSKWQYDRYVAKKAYFTLLEKQDARGVVDLNMDTESWASEYHVKTVVSGRWDHKHSMVLINRSMGSIPGVKVVTPLVVSTDDGKERALLVDRGFLPFEDFENGWLGKQTDGEVNNLEGILRPSQHATFRFAPPEQPAMDGGYKVRWMRLTCEAMAEQLPYDVVPVFLEQTARTDAYPMYDPREIIGPPRHLNYSFQWGGFAIFSLFIGTMMQFPKIRPEERKEKTA